jgi:hypothetical protein
MYEKLKIKQKCGSSSWWSSMVDALEYLTLKYWPDFAKKAMKVIENVLDDNIFYN